MKKKTITTVAKWGMGCMGTEESVLSEWRVSKDSEARIYTSLKGSTRALEKVISIKTLSTKNNASPRYKQRRQQTCYEIHQQNNGSTARRRKVIKTIIQLCCGGGINKNNVNHSKGARRCLV